MSRNTTMAKWKTYLKGEQIKIFDYTNLGEGTIESLEEILKGGQNTLFEAESDLMNQNYDYSYSMFEAELTEFIRDENIPDEDQEIINNDLEFRDELRFEFEDHVDLNFEVLYDYDVLIFEKMYPVDYDGMETKIDWKNSQSVAFRKRALKYITKDEFNSILINAYGGEGYIGAIVNGTELVTAIRNDKKTVGGNVVVGVHDWMNGAGMYEESQDYIDLKLENASIDSGDYGVGGTFGSANWKY